MEDLSQKIPAPLCGHRGPLLVRGYRRVCATCGSFWDEAALTSPARYDESYPKLRSHFDPQVGRSKVRTLRSWLRATGVSPDGRVVCEVGFGGAFCLADIRLRARRVFGVETIHANLEHAAELGVNREDLIHAAALPERLPDAVDLWIYQDSFEHVPDPAAHLEWLSANSSQEAGVLVVLPDASTLSQRLLGPWWPHRLDDHLFHWSREGLAGLFSSHGFSVAHQFFPWKHVTVGTLFAHLLHKTRRLESHASLVEALRKLPGSVRFNIGETGFYFVRSVPA
jgi:hypothetical protein